MMALVFIKVLPLIEGAYMFYDDIVVDMLSWLACSFCLILYSKIFYIGIAFMLSSTPPYWSSYLWRSSSSTLFISYSSIFLRSYSTLSLARFLVGTMADSSPTSVPLMDLEAFRSN